MNLQRTRIASASPAGNGTTSRPIGATSDAPRATREDLAALGTSAKAVPPEPASVATIDVRSLNVKDDRGEVRFLLQRVAGGLYVECERMPRRGLHSVQAVRFIAAADFHQWLNDGPIRFEHPLLHVSLKRNADDLWRFPAQPSDE